MESEVSRNLAAVLTPAGVGAIGVLRIAGPGVCDFLGACFSRPTIAGRCIHGELRDDKQLIDDPVVVLAAGGQGADINLHGGRWVLQAALNLVQRHGFLVVDAKNAPIASFALDAIEEIEREMLAYLPRAGTQLALRVLLGQPAAWKRLTEGPISLAVARRTLADRSLHWLLNPPRVAIVGIPNAGKSTSANQLFGQQRSITADLPGTTRDWVGESANLDGLVITLIDTPGIRESADAIETQAIDRAKSQFDLADAVVHVMDATRMHDGTQRALVERFPDAIRVFNKIDAAPGLNLDDAAILTVATTGEGIDALRSAIRKRFQCDGIDPNLARCWTLRQAEVLRLI